MGNNADKSEEKGDEESAHRKKYSNYQEQPYVAIICQQLFFPFHYTEY